MRTVMSACVALLAFVHPAQAQPTFADVKPSGLPTVFVTDRAGQETSGKLIKITDQDITIAANGVEKTFRADEVSLIERKGDSLKNGTIAGLVVGLALSSLAAGISDCPEGKSSCPGNRATLFVGGTAIYTAIGTAIDAAITGRTRMWPAKGKAAGAPVALVSPTERRLFVGWRISR